MAQQGVPGGWSGFHFELTEEAQKVFAAALEGLVGMTYTPVAFATQVVAGMDYCYLCRGVPSYQGAPETAFKVYVYVPSEGTPHLTTIDRILP